MWALVWGLLNHSANTSELSLISPSGRPVRPPLSPILDESSLVSSPHMPPTIPPKPSNTQSSKGSDRSGASGQSGQIALSQRSGQSGGPAADFFQRRPTMPPTGSRSIPVGSALEGWTARGDVEHWMCELFGLSHEGESEKSEQKGLGLLRDEVHKWLNGTTSGRRGKFKSARIAGGGFRVHWARWKQRLGTGSAPSESLLNDTGETSDGSRSAFRSALGHNQQGGEDTDDAAEVDEIVVDNALGTVTSQPSEHGGTGHGSGRPDLQGIKSQTNSFGTMETHYSGFWGSNFISRFLRWTAWPIIDDFFRGNFVVEKLEQEYRRELWWSGKTLALYSSVFFIVHWILILALSARPFTLSDKIFFYGIGPLISIPIPFLVIFDYPFKGSKKQIAFQIYISIFIAVRGTLLGCFFSLLHFLL
ncbi:hypothetical protein ACEPAF_2402 [Sanghuangporus sanghuang]